MLPALLPQLLVTAVCLMLAAIATCRQFVLCLARPPARPMHLARHLLGKQDLLTVCSWDEMAAAETA